MGDQDPHSWGRFYWALLHRVAERVAQHPQLRAPAMDLLWTLRDVLPCTSCRKCFRSNLQQNPPQPDCDLEAWLLKLEESVEQRQRLMPTDAFVVSVVPRRARPPVGTGDDEIGLVVAFALKAAAGRNHDELVRWTRSFVAFLRGLVLVLGPPDDSVVRVFAQHAAELPSMQYDLYRYLEGCVAEHAQLIRSREQAARRERARQKQAAKGQARDPHAAVLAAHGIHGGGRTIAPPAPPPAPPPRPERAAPHPQVLERLRAHERVRRPSSRVSLGAPRAGRRLQPSRARATAAPRRARVGGTAGV